MSTEAAGFAEGLVAVGFSEGFLLAPGLLFFAEVLLKASVGKKKHSGAYISYIYGTSHVIQHRFQRRKRAGQGIGLNSLGNYTLQDPDGVKTSAETAEKRSDVYISYVNIGLSNGVRIEHHRLSYGELVCFINKLQSLCSA